MKYVYSFKEGNKDMRELLGGKGANLAEMTSIGLPVPDGHQHLAAERPRHRADGETFYRQGRRREVLRHVLGVRTGTGGASAHRG